MNNPKENQVPIAWIDVDDDFREYLGLTDFNGQLPMLIWNLGAEGLEDNGQLQLGDRELALGCLLLLQDAIKGEIEPQYSTNEDAMLHVLDRHRDVAELESLEQVVLSLAEFAGEKVDIGLKLAMLVNGLIIAPDSKAILNEIKTTEAMMSRGPGH